MRCYADRKAEKERNAVTVRYVDGPRSSLIVYDKHATHTLFGARDIITRDPRTNRLLIEISNRIEQNMEQIMPQSCNAKPG